LEQWDANRSKNAGFNFVNNFGDTKIQKAVFSTLFHYGITNLSLDRLYRFGKIYKRPSAPEHVFRTAATRA
jgi:hypothetical protein